MKGLPSCEGHSQNNLVGFVKDEKQAANFLLCLLKHVVYRYDMMYGNVMRE